MSGIAPPVLYVFEDGVARAGGDLAGDAFYTMSDMPIGPAFAHLQTMKLGTEDAIEGVTALLQKRDPARKGR